MISDILVVCTGNICRSPMAEGLLKRALPGLEVGSAGTHALVGEPADEHAVRIMLEQGVDIRAHRARQLNSRVVSDANLILVMELVQKQFIESRYPSSKGKVFRLGEFRKYDIDDPYRRGEAAFRRSCELIAAGVEDVAQRIAAMA